ncbi:hypothetical protein AVDCRST_MAG82-3259, partial [uncultured Rubrobacteraceae bacterium]
KFRTPLGESGMDWRKFRMLSMRRTLYTTRRHAVRLTS